jgi:DivIVA domain-containing protein
MTDTSGTPMFPARDARLTPEAIAERSFTQVKRGYAESEVRAFLRMVSDDLVAMRNRERELAARAQELEERLARPAAPPSDQDLIAALGEETARVLSQAREAAVDLRNKADEHARRVVREAQEAARELRASTQQAVETKTREAEDAARTRAREIVAEARSLRERVLTDLNERRGDLERQIAELRAARGKLVEAYEIVERALSQAHRTMAEEPSLPATAVAAPEPEAPSGYQPESAPGAEAETEAEVGGAEPETGAGAEQPDEGRDVGALFEKLRSAAAPTGDGGEEAAETEGAGAPASPTAGQVETPEAAPVEAAGLPDEEPAVDTIESEEPDDADRALLAARDEALGSVADDLAHRAKRALQDEQNDVLDGLRRQRGKIDPSKVLPPAQEQMSRWAHVLQPAVDQAYAAGVASMPSDTSGRAAPAVPGALLTELATAVVTPLRTRLESSLESIDAKSPADVEIAVAQRLGARYREWRGQDLEEVLGDALAVAYTRGAFDAAPDGARLRWVPARVGKCPDCDDNALEPTVRGEPFPTGQPHPPAHPGCRCLVVLATD